MMRFCNCLHAMIKMQCYCTGKYMLFMIVLYPSWYIVK